MKIIFVCTLFSLLSFSFAGEVGGINYSDSQKINGKDLVLNGIGLREATIFKVNIYAGALYLEKKSSNGDEIANSNQYKSLFMTFLRDVSKDKMSDAFSEGYKKNCNDKCDGNKAHLDQLISSIADLHKDDVLQINFESNKLEVIHNGVNKTSITSPEFGTIILKIWVGASPPNESLKKGLLGN